MPAKFRFLIPAIGLLILASCGSDPLKVDLSGVKVEPVKILRFEKDFFALSASDIEAGIPELERKYPGFADLYINNIVCPMGLKDSSCIPAITKFILDKDMREVYDATQATFTDMSAIEEALTDILRHHKYYFPERSLPQIYTMMSGFNFSIVTADSNFAVALEKYVGGTGSFYSRLEIPSYKQYTMRKEFIPVDVARAWIIRDFPDEGKSGTLLNEMIYQGKILYLMDALMPETDDTLKIGFSKKQMRWCEEHEKDVWGHLIQNKFLYASERDVIAKFTGEGPFTTGFVKESPARTGIWLGWRIVRDYMKANPKTTLGELMHEKDAQILLSKSKYKP